MGMPPELAGHLNLEGPPVVPRPAATVVVARGDRPWELLLVHRPGGADFAPGAYVFPGGSVHAEDAAWPDDVRAAAVRELFEEVGILLARRSGRFAGQADARRLRDAVAGGLGFSAALRSCALEPAFDRLVLFARWITPAQLRRRFDTSFYLARMPAGQAVLTQEGEVTDWMWISPRRALEAPDVTLVYATRAVLESLVTDDPLRRVFARARRLRDVPTVEPRIVQTPGGWEIVRG